MYKQTLHAVILTYIIIMYVGKADTDWQFSINDKELLSIQKILEIEF